MSYIEEVYFTIIFSKLLLADMWRRLFSFRRKDQGPAVDMHPEKRVKAAFTAFEAKRLPELKAENPNLRLSQLKQILKKEWQKCPDNPLAFR